MKVVIFGADKFASLAWYCLTHDSPHDVVGFTVNEAYLKSATHHDLPVIPFERLEETFAPGEHSMLVHLGGVDANRLRTARYGEAKEKGYDFITYVSSRAETWPDLTIGTNCAVYEGTVIQPFAKIGDDVIIRSSVHVSHHGRIEDHCFIAAGVCLGGGVTIRERTFVGLNATIRDGVTIAPGCVIAAGAVVSKDTEPDGLYGGVPAKRMKDL
jgi:sugar O-acyltransferase (sialic acid O-acetyltransferase NeuD family)